MTAQALSSGRAFAATGDAHMVIIGGNGAGLAHSIRSANGFWQLFGDVEGQAGELVDILDTSTAVIAGELHVLAINRIDGHLYHAVRLVHRSWTRFEDVTQIAGGPPRTRSVCAAEVCGQLHIVITDGAGAVRHAVRFSDGEWQPFANVEQPAAGDPGSAVDVAAVGFGRTLQVAVATVDGRMFHTRRAPSGSWRPFADVTLAANGPLGVARVSAAASSGNFQIYAVTREGDLFLGVRTGAGAWQNFIDLRDLAGVPGLVEDVAAAGTPLNDGQILIAQTDGSLLHGIRVPNRGWQQVRDVMAAGDLDRPIIAVTIAIE